MDKQAGRIIEFLTLIDKVAGRIAVSSAEKPKGLFVASLRSKLPAPPLPPKEDSLKTAI